MASTLGILEKVTATDEDERKAETFIDLLSNEFREKGPEFFRIVIAGIDLGGDLLGFSGLLMHDLMHRTIGLDMAVLLQGGKIFFNSHVQSPSHPLW